MQVLYFKHNKHIALTNNTLYKKIKIIKLIF